MGRASYIESPTDTELHHRGTLPEGTFSGDDVPLPPGTFHSAAIPITDDEEVNRPLLRDGA